MIKKQSLSKNLIFQFLYQGLILVIPFILSPYLTRTLQETALGVYSYTNSIAYYFVMFSMLGISRHGQRIISQSADDEISLRRTFWSLFVVHVLVSVFFTLLYCGFVLFFVNEYVNIYLIQTFYVLSALFDITWLFYGLENFKSVVVKNTVVKVAECALIFLVVRTPQDLWKYTLITTCGLLIGQIVMIPQAVKMIKPIRFSVTDMLQHIKPLLVFSISVIAVSLYTVFDKTLLGLLSTKENVAFYEYSNRIITIPKTIIGTVGTVMFPRACRLASEGDVKGQKKYMEDSFLLTFLIGMGSIFGLLAVGEQLAAVYYGEAFRVCGNVIMALSPLIVIIGVGDIIRTQYMIPNHMDKQFNICIMLNAVVNIILSASLIPVVGIYGAVIGTVAAEVFGIVVQLAICKKFIKIKDIVRSALPFLCIGIVMYIILKFLALHMNNGIMALIVLVLLGGIFYIALSILYFALFRKEFLRVVLRRRKR